MTFPAHTATPTTQKRVALDVFTSDSADVHTPPYTLPTRRVLEDAFWSLCKTYNAGYMLAYAAPRAFDRSGFGGVPAARKGALKGHGRGPAHRT